MPSDEKVPILGGKTLLSTEKMQIPAEYRRGYEKACHIDKESADRYVAHTMIGDPVMDNLLDELDGLDQVMVERMIRAGMDQQYDALKKAPRALRDFFVDSPPPDPPWHDPTAFDPGIRAFQRNSSNVLGAFVAGVLIEGFSTLISKSFVTTGRLFEKGVVEAEAEQPPAARDLLAWRAGTPRRGMEAVGARAFSCTVRSGGCCRFR